MEATGKLPRRAGISGTHVHPHTTRHTVAWTLGALGNEVHLVADFVGHKSPQVTNDVYIDVHDVCNDTGTKKESANRALAYR